MPARISRSSSSPTRQTGITKFTNCLLVRNNRLVAEDLWISTLTGKVLESQSVFYDHLAAPDEVIDLGGRILAPGFLDVQLNGGFGFDFSILPENITDYAKGVKLVNKKLVKTGVTSYLPTVTSQRSELYPKVLPYIGPSGARRDPSEGAESLGAHIEGPFISKTKNGIHNVSVLQQADNGFSDLEACFGASNLLPESTPVKLITLAPELPGAISNIDELTRRGIIVSIGHSEATYEEACDAVCTGATMITHLFNAMRPLHHRNPGIFGLLGTASKTQTFNKPYFGIIADGIHLHRTSIQIAYQTHPSGLILVTDAMALSGLPDGTYPWTNSHNIVKRGYLLTLDTADGKIAGSSISLIECVNNFLAWTGAGVAEAIGTVTSTPAKMLGMDGVKGSLQPGADADLVVLEEVLDEQTGLKELKVEQVWKFGKCVHASDE